MPAFDSRLPVLVLTGFLGSGKTSLLNRLLREGPKTAVLINEFGSTPVDQRLIEQQGVPLMTLRDGSKVRVRFEVPIPFPSNRMTDQVKLRTVV